MLIELPRIEFATTFNCALVKSRGNGSDEQIFGRIQQVRERGKVLKHNQMAREPLCGAQTQARRISNVPHTYDRRSIGSRALNCCVRAARASADSGHA
jgi:hypothetical protein